MRTPLLVVTLLALVLGSAGPLAAQAGDPPPPKKQDPQPPKDEDPPQPGPPPKPPSDEEPTPPPKKAPDKPAKPKPATSKGHEGVRYFPLQAGRRWTYTVTFSIKPLGKAADEGAADQGKHRVDVYVGGQVKVQEQPTVSLEWKLDSNLAQRCYYEVSDGYLRCVRRLQGAGQHVKNWAFAPSQPVVPINPKVGMKWTWEGKNGTDTGKQEFEVLRKETIETPAGKFKTIVIRSTYSGQDDSTGTQTRWLAPKVGIVKELNVVKNARQEFRTEGILRRYLAP